MCQMSPMATAAVFHAKGSFSLPPLRPTRIRDSTSFQTALRINRRKNPSIVLPLSALPSPHEPHDHGFLKKQSDNLVYERREGGGDHAGCCKAAGGISAPSDDGGGEKPKLLGVEVQTLKKIVPLGLMFFCILFNYTILRDTKDVLVVTAKGSSAEIIPFLKTWVNLPMAVGFMLLYTKLSNVLSREALFYTVIIPFIVFFGAFGLVLYPLSDAIHPTALADKLLATLGPSFLGPVAILRIWSFCLFYVMAELWGSVVISVLFWGFANQVTSSSIFLSIPRFLSSFSRLGLTFYFKMRNDRRSLSDCLFRRLFS